MTIYSHRGDTYRFVRWLSILTGVIHTGLFGDYLFSQWWYIQVCSMTIYSHIGDTYRFVRWLSIITSVINTDLFGVYLFSHQWYIQICSVTIYSHIGDTYRFVWCKEGVHNVWEDFDASRHFILSLHHVPNVAQHHRQQHLQSQEPTWLQFTIMWPSIIDSSTCRARSQNGYNI